MKKLFAGSDPFRLAGLPVWAALKVADKAPDFSARASLAGKQFNFSLPDALKKGPVVVYFYPSAYTKGCDLEAHTFAQEKDKFDAAGATIIGVSADSIERLDAFSADPGLLCRKVSRGLRRGSQNRDLLRSDGSQRKTWHEGCARRRDRP